MQLTRTFTRLPRDLEPKDVDAWAQRMDGLLVASPADLVDFIHDALTALLARSKPDVTLEHLVNGIVESLATEEFPQVLNQARRRWRQMLHVFRGRGITEGQVRDHLGEIARNAPWDPRYEAQVLRLAQALWTIRDTTAPSEYVQNVIARALDEAGVIEPEEEDHP